MRKHRGSMLSRAMGVFSSHRERRLWMLLLAVVVAIYSTLTTANQFAGLLRDRGLLDPAFALGMLLVGLAVVVYAWQPRAKALSLAISLGIVAAYFMAFVRMVNTAERTHLIEYGIVAILAFEALKERRLNGRQVPMPALGAILLTFTFGVLDECIQLILPSRVFDLRDILFNGVAAIMAVLSSSALEKIRTRK